MILLISFVCIFVCMYVLSHIMYWHWFCLTYLTSLVYVFTAPQHSKTEGLICLGIGNGPWDYSKQWKPRNTFCQKWNRWDLIHKSTQTYRNDIILKDISFLSYHMWMIQIFSYNISLHWYIFYKIKNSSIWQIIIIIAIYSSTPRPHA